MPPPRLLVVDPRPLWRRGLRAALEPAARVTAEAAHASEALAHLGAVDLVVVHAQAADAPEVARAAAEAGVPVLALGPPNGLLAAQWMRLGARGYLPATAPLDAFTEAVGAAAAGEPRWHVAPAPGPALTPREHDVLRRLAEGRSNAEIAADLGVSVSTTRTHLAGASAKIGARTAREAMAWVWRHVPPAP